jgi:hypothetical protein
MSKCKNTTSEEVDIYSEILKAGLYTLFKITKKNIKDKKTKI